MLFLMSEPFFCLLFVGIFVLLVSFFNLHSNRYKDCAYKNQRQIKLKDQWYFIFYFSRIHGQTLLFCSPSNGKKYFYYKISMIKERKQDQQYIPSAFDYVKFYYGEMQLENIICPRFGHSAGIIENKLFIYGGNFNINTNCLYEFNLDTHTTKVYPMKDISLKIESHSCNVVKNQLIIFGGFNSNKQVTKEMIRLQYVNNEIDINGIVINKNNQFPFVTARQSHATCSFLDRYILIFGGSYWGKQNKQSLQSYNQNSDKGATQRRDKKDQKKNSSVEGKRGPEDRKSSVSPDNNNNSSSRQKKLASNRGIHKANNSQIEQIEPENQVSRVYRQRKNKGSRRQKQLKQDVGMKKQGVPDDQNQAKQHPFYLNDFLIFDCQENRWILPKLQSNPINPRSGATLAYINDQQFYLFGGEGENDELFNDMFKIKHKFNEKGEHLLEIQKVNYSKLIKSPKVRANHTMVPNYEKDMLVLIGGEHYQNEKNIQNSQKRKLEGLPDESSSQYENEQGSDNTIRLIKKNKKKRKSKVAQNKIAKLKERTQFLSDIWIFDIKGKLWKRVQQIDDFIPRSGFTANNFNRSIILFGGLSEYSWRKQSQDPFAQSNNSLGLLLIEDHKMTFCDACFRGKEIEKDDETSQITQFKQFFTKNLFLRAREITHPFNAFRIIFDGLSRLQGLENVYIQLSDKTLLLECRLYHLQNKIFEDLSIIQSQDYSQFLITSESLFIFNLRNGCARLGKQILFIRKQSSGHQTQLILMRPDCRIIKCKISDDGILGINLHKNDKKIMDQYLKYHKIPLNLIKPPNFTVIISEFYSIKKDGKVVADREFLLTPQQDIQTLVHRSNLRTCCKKMFLQPPEVNFYINNKQIDFGNNFNEYKSEDWISLWEKEIDSSIGQIFIKKCEEIGKILIYKQNIYVGRCKIEKFEGYVQLSANYNLTFHRDKVVEEEKIIQQIKRLCNQVLQSERKRDNPVSVEMLRRESKL